MWSLPGVSTVLTLGLNLFSRVVNADILPTDQLLAGVQDVDWFKANVPILDVPDVNISRIYYFRWEVYKEHLLYTGPLAGYITTEWLTKQGYSGPYGAISAAVGHMIHEGRWLRNQKYGKDNVNFWLNGGARWPKPTNEKYNPNTNIWSQMYSMWIGTSVLAQAAVTGDSTFAIGHLENLVRYYENYSPQFNSDLGLYWQVPVWDASEFTAASYAANDPYKGGAGYRPTINAFQYGDAMAIAQLAGLSGNSELQSTYKAKADALRQATQNLLWDNGAQFFKHMMRENNPNRQLLKDREYMGYLPWQFNLPVGSNDTVAFQQLKDSNGFQSQFGPTTLERRSDKFMYEATRGCCRWDGPSWPYATSGVLAALENLLNNYDANEYINKGDYFNLFKGYTMTHFQSGQPQVYEAHFPDEDNWIYKNPGGDDDYQHSTYVQNVIAGLVGIRAQLGNTLVVNPLAPVEWPHWGLENVAYHGHSLTVLWDRDGLYYNKGKGLLVFINGNLAGSSPTLSRITINNVPNPVLQRPSSQVNIAANFDNLPNAATASATFTSNTGGTNEGDQAKHVLDGSVWRNGILTNSRWTTFQSYNPRDTLTVTFPRLNAFNTINLWFYDDQGGVRLPSNYSVQCRDKSGNWQDIQQQQRNGKMASNTKIQISFPEIVASGIRITANNPSPGSVGWGLSEVEVWTAPIYVIKNSESQLYMGTTSNSSNLPVLQQDDNGSANNLWQLIPAPGGWFQIKNIGSSKFLSTNGSSSNSTNIIQQDNTSRDDQLWRFQDFGDEANNIWADGRTAIYNKASGLVAGVAGESKDKGANVVQYANTPTADHWWALIPSVPAGASSVGL